MRSLKTNGLLIAFALALAGCASVPPAQPQPELTCPKPPAPPAWLMLPAPDLMKSLNGIISISEPGLKPPSGK